MKYQFAFLIITALASSSFPQQANLELHVGDKTFTQDTAVDVAPNCSLKIDCQIVNKSIPADSLKLFYGVNAPNDIISFPKDGGSFFYVPQMQDTAQQVVLEFRLFYGDTPLSSLQLSINVLQASKIAAPSVKRAVRPALLAQSASYDLAGRLISRTAHSLAIVQRAASGNQAVLQR
jgi:hypothetical protein